MCTIGVGCSNPDNILPCDDGIFCNGNDTCSTGTCSSHAGNPCPETECNTCQEGSDSCFDPAGTVCTADANICTDDECNGAGVMRDTPTTQIPVMTGFSVLKTIPAQAEPARGPQRTVQEQATSATTGSAMRQETSASRSPSQTAQYAMTAFTVLRQMNVMPASVLAAMIPALTTHDYCDGVEYCEEDSSNYICSSTNSVTDPCSPLFCNDLLDECQGSDVDIIVSDVFGYVGTIDIELENAFDSISAFQVDICDADSRDLAAPRYRQLQHHCPEHGFYLRDN